MLIPECKNMGAGSPHLARRQMEEGSLVRVRRTTPWSSDHGPWLPQKSADRTLNPGATLGKGSYLYPKCLPLSYRTNCTWSGSVQATCALDSESDAEERGDSGTPGWKDRVRPPWCLWNTGLMTQVAVVTLSLNLTLNVTRHEASTVQMDRGLEHFPSPLITFIFPNIPMFCLCLAFGKPWCCGNK